MAKQRNKKYNPNKTTHASKEIVAMLYRGAGLKPNEEQAMTIELYCRVNLEAVLDNGSRSAMHNIRLLLDTIMVLAVKTNHDLLGRLHGSCVDEVTTFDVDAKTTPADRKQHFKNLIRLINYFCGCIGSFTLKAYKDARVVAGNHVTRFLASAINNEPTALKQMTRDILDGLSFSQAATKYGLLLEHVKICFYRITGSLFLLERDFTNVSEPDNLQSVLKYKRRYINRLNQIDGLSAPINQQQAA